MIWDKKSGPRVAGRLLTKIKRIAFHNDLLIHSISSLLPSAHVVNGTLVFVTGHVGRIEWEGKAPKRPKKASQSEWEEKKITDDTPKTSGRRRI